MSVRSKLILASASPRRTQLLKQMGVAHEVKVAREVVEKLADEDLAASELVEYNARLKAEAVVAATENRVVLAADTLVFLGNEPLGKPSNAQQAIESLMRLSGRDHHVVSAVCLAGPGRSQLSLFHDVTRVRFRNLRAADVSRYMELVHVYDKAGGYALQEHGEMLVDSVQGSRDNVIGLPTEMLQRELDKPQWARVLALSGEIVTMAVWWWCQLCAGLQLLGLVAGYGCA